MVRSIGRVSLLNPRDFHVDKESVKGDFLRRRSVKFRLLVVFVCVVRLAVHGMSTLMVGLVSILLVFVLFTGYVDLWTTRRHAGGSVFWRALVAFDASQLRVAFSAFQGSSPHRL